MFALRYSQARKPRCENIPWGRLNGYSGPKVCYFGKTIYNCENEDGETYTGDEKNDNVRVLNENVRGKLIMFVDFQIGSFVYF